MIWILYSPYATEHFLRGWTKFGSLTKTVETDVFVILFCLNHLSIAFGSLMELGTLLKISNELHYLKSDDHKKLSPLCDEIGKMLNGLMTSLKRKNTDS